jgi:putative ABC transport system ATP-binding protein
MSHLPSLPVLSVRDLVKTYREGSVDRAVLQGLSFEIRKGELVVLLGRSGSGKSTLLNLISGMDAPTSGSIRFRDTELTKLSETERTLFRRHAIGIIFQSFNLIPTLKVEENILLPLELGGKLDKDKRQRALAVLEEVGLADRAGSFPDLLSGGEQQRVAIARALAHDPLLILADEPTGNLDFKTAGLVMDILERIVHDKERTMLIATHDRDIIGLADRVFELQEGVLREVSPAESAH